MVHKGRDFRASNVTFRSPGPWFDGLLIAAAVLAGCSVLAGVGMSSPEVQVAMVFAAWTPPGRAVAPAATTGCDRAVTS